MDKPIDTKVEKGDVAALDELIGQMTLDEKIGMIHGNGLFRTEGVERLGIPPLKFSDGPMGVRMEFDNSKWIPVGNTDDYVSYLPSNSAIASTWNRDMAYKAGQVLGEEARGRGKDVILAPGVNLKRSPLCGRNFEYLSEDPMLTASMTVSLVKGIQENDVAACVKHFAANSQETNRLHLDTKIDERTLQEIYYPAFRAAVQDGGVYSVMGAYNKLNGSYCCENKALLEDVLQKRWGFDGTVISDWGAVHGTKEAAMAPLDVEMSVFDNFDDYCLAEPLKEAVKRGEIEEKQIDLKVRNILRMMVRLKMIGREAGERKSGSYNTPLHRQILLEAASESVILLKNEENILPWNKEKLRGKKLAVIGCQAECIHSCGGGSAEIKALYEISPLMGIKTHLGGNTEVKYAPGYRIPPKPEENSENWQADSVVDQEAVQKHLKELREEKKRRKKELFDLPGDEEAVRLQKEALKLAEECDEVLFIGGLNHDFDIEGEDRPYMRLPYHQDELIEKLLEIRPDMTIVMIAGSPVEMQWVTKARALLWSYYAGMETGTAVADVLFGIRNPSGKLAETMPVCYEDTATGRNGQFGKEDQVSYEEGVMVGYRHFEKYQIKPNFCFGHGLSYTTFKYADLRADVCEKKEEVIVAVKFTLENVGNLAGAEVVQIYVGDEEASAERPVKELKAYQKIYLQPKEKRQVEILLDQKAFGFYKIQEDAFCVEPGKFFVYVNSSSDDCRLWQEVQINGMYSY